MTDPYTLKKLTEVEDSAPNFGFTETQERLDAIRVAPGVIRAFEGGPEGIELLAFGPRHDGDGELIQDWWTD